ncbi:ESX secretion-associated protein EspG [Nocardia nova]|uniref:ESX secretion-associated protein EspG n=1 Tax=Nocardia nova TaxID=37330 RepID=UPI00046D7367|nr:ESX secretion-associated protein EspG [Nocardia nova]
MHSSRFSAQEFEILLAAYGRDRLPYPIQFTTSATDFDDLRTQREAAVDTLLTKHSAELVRAVEVLLDPEGRVESKGFGGPGLTQVYRFHGAIRDESAAAVRQEPGPSEETGGDVIVTCCAAGQLAQHLVRSLPRRPAGTGAPIEVRRDDVIADRHRPVRRAYEPTLVERLDGLFKRPRTGLGEIRIHPGAAVDSRPAPARGFWWMDYEDGRYYVRTGDPIIAKPLPPKAMATEIHRLLSLTRRYHREDRDHEEYLRTR